MAPTPADRSPESLTRALTIICPVCRARPGRKCSKNGHANVPVHSGRINAAARLG